MLPGPLKWFSNAQVAPFAALQSKEIFYLSFKTKFRNWNKQNRNLFMHPIL